MPHKMQNSFWCSGNYSTALIARIRYSKNLVQTLIFHSWYSFK